MSDVRHLRALQALDSAATYSSMSKAADALGVTYGAVSREVKQLEDYLGVSLLHREATGVNETQAGEQRHVATRQAVIALEAGLRTAKRESHGRSVTLSLSTSLA